ncbi:MAG: 3'-5' exonuclease [Bacteroidales bacterium]|jgi:DNA polymerase-3 subunit epsilon|nr:3'-5' exonuclease [Bacteroidales bacterium]
MDNFAAIDFETANSSPSSVCSVGVVIVKNGEIVQKIYHLIHPYPNYYKLFHTSIHGLRKEDTQDAAKFPQIWALIAPQIEGLPLVAHNSPFDERCLKAAFAAYEMEYLDYQFFCTCKAARQKFGKTLPNHQLHTVAAHVGFDLTHHHNALSDAEAAAWIAKCLL